MTNTEYVELFTLIGVVEKYGGAYGCKPGLVATELVAQGMKSQDVDTADRVDVKKAEEVCRKCYLSCMLLCRADNSWYFQLKVDLSNEMTKGIDNFPKTIVKTMRLLTDYVPLPRLQRAHNPDGKGLAFVQGKSRASHGPKKEAPTRKSSAGTAADRTTRISAPSSSCWMRVSRTSTSIRATKSTPYSLQTADMALSRSR